MIARWHRTMTGGTALETDSSGVVRTGTGEVFTWGDRDEASLLLAELDRPEETIHLTGARSPDINPARDALVDQTRADIFGGDDDPETAEAKRRTRQQVHGEEHDPETAASIDLARRLVADVPAGRDVRAHRRLPDFDAHARERPDGLREMLAKDGQLRRLHGQISESTKPLQRPPAPEPPRGKGRTTPLHRQGLPALADATIAQLRAMAASADPAQRARIRHAVNAMPSLAGVLGTDLLNRLREDAAGDDR